MINNEVLRHLSNVVSSIIKSDPYFIEEFYLNLTKRPNLYPSYNAMELYGSLVLKEDDDYMIYYKIHKDDPEELKKFDYMMDGEGLIAVGEYALREREFLMKMMTDRDYITNNICIFVSFVYHNYTGNTKYYESATYNSVTVSPLIDVPQKYNYIIAYPVMNDTDYTYDFDKEEVVLDQGHMRRFAVAALMEAIRVFNITTKEQLIQVISA